MPFKSQAQMKAAFGGYLGPEMKKKASKWAEETPNIKKLPKHVKNEAVRGTEPLNTVNFWVVLKPTSYESTMNDIITQCDPFEFVDMARAGLAPDQVYGFYIEEDEAMEEALKLLQGLYNEAKALEEKKGEVSSKLEKTIDKLQKQAEDHMKMVKKDPENAEKHHAEAEKLMARIKELRGKHKMVEGSKKELKEMDYEKSGLKNPKKADLDKNKDISGYEQKRGKAIEKSIKK